jgi:hypothetical protein
VDFNLIFYLNQVVPMVRDDHKSFTAQFLGIISGSNPRLSSKTSRGNHNPAYIWGESEAVAEGMAAVEIKCQVLLLEMIKWLSSGTVPEST